MSKESELHKLHKYHTSDKQARYNTSTFLEVCYACFYGILAVPLLIIGTIFLAQNTPPFGSYIAMLIVGLVLLVMFILATLNASWLRHYANADPKRQKTIKILQIVTLNIYGYMLLNPEKPKKKKKTNQEDEVQASPEPQTQNA